MYKQEILKQDQAFQDKECTCQCGNKHELYGGKGYKSLPSITGDDLYMNKVECNVCNNKHTLIIKYT